MRNHAGILCSCIWKVYLIFIVWYNVFVGEVKTEYIWRIWRTDWSYFWWKCIEILCISPFEHQTNWLGQERRRGDYYLSNSEFFFFCWCPFLFDPVVYFLLQHLITHANIVSSCIYPEIAVYQRNSLTSITTIDCSLDCKGWFLVQDNYIESRTRNALHVRILDN